MIKINNIQTHDTFDRSDDLTITGYDSIYGEIFYSETASNNKQNLGSTWT